MTAGTPIYQSFLPYTDVQPVVGIRAVRDVPKELA